MTDRLLQRGRDGMRERGPGEDGNKTRKMWRKDRRNVGQRGHDVLSFGWFVSATKENKQQERP